MGRKKSTVPPVASPTPATGPAPQDNMNDTYSRIMSGYQNFADTGGFSPEDLANLRARSMSPIRAVYANAIRNVERNKALQGGYSPNYGAQMAKLSREQSISQAEHSLNTEADLAEMVQRNKLAGLGGMLDTYRSADRGGGGGGGGEQEAPKKKSKWSVLGKIAKIAAPIALAYFTCGTGNAVMAGAGGVLSKKGGGKGIRATPNLYPYSQPRATLLR